MKLHYGFDEISQINWAGIMPIVLPFLFVGFLLIMIALVDLYRHRQTRENLFVWTIVILLFNTIGPILYFTMGRKDGNERAVRNR